MLSLIQLREKHVQRGRPLPVEVEAALRLDPRPGARALLLAIDKRRRERRSEGQRLRKMLRFETELWSQGIERVAGIDEAGMSPLAGPVCAAAVIFSPGTRIVGVDDSKKLDANERERLAEVVREKALAWGVGWASPEEIDRINIYWAGLLAMRRAFEALSPEPEHVLLDARKLRDVTIPQQAIVRGDARSLTIAAASILAKTSRDAKMRELDREYPGYGFGQHKGYPVREHVEALQKLGACPVHRRSFTPVRNVLGVDAADVRVATAEIRTEGACSS